MGSGLGMGLRMVLGIGLGIGLALGLGDGWVIYNRPNPLELKLRPSGIFENK